MSDGAAVAEAIIVAVIAAVVVARRHLTVIIDHPAGHDELIVRADHRDHLSTAFPELVKIAKRIGNVSDVA